MEFELKYSGEEINELLDKAGTALQSVPLEYVTDAELNDKGYLTEHQDISGKQETLVSGENIKTLNGQSLLGTGNIEVISSIPDCESPEGAEGYIRNKTHYTEVISELLPFNTTNGGTILLSGITPFTCIEFRNHLVGQRDICLSVAESGVIVSLPVSGPEVEAVWNEDEDGTLSLVQTTESNYGILNIIYPFVVNFKQLPSAYLSGDIARTSEVEEVRTKVDSVLGEDGYVYSNGEKVDMRFTRSLLPVGTSIPAKANLNTKEFLKIGKYYCSLNVDAKTITNCPTAEAFSMEVFNPLGTNVDDEDTRDYTYRLRVLTAYKTGVQYIQYCATSGTAGSWTYNGWFVVPRTSFSLNSSKNGGTAAKGASNRGVYIDSTGTFQQMGYTVAKSVPSNAVFTDTNTKVTSVGNHYAPAEDTDAELSAPDGEVVVGIKRDAAGHVVGLATALGGGSSATPDWDASDGQEGHILNRTHYVNGSFVEMESIGQTNEDVWFENDGINKDLMLVRLQLGEESIEFTIESSSSKEIVFGGKTMEFCYISSSEVCVYGENLYDLRCFINDYVFDEQSYSQLIKQLDEKFIPSTIARKSDIDNAIAASITNVLNTPV